MNYSLGCAFSLDDALLNFPYKSLNFTCNDCYKIIKDKHRNILIKKIFLFNVKQVINDVILNNVTFDLPLVGIRKCCIKMKPFRGEEFKKLRRSGKWQSIDLISSMFTGYTLSLFMAGKRTPRVKSIYLNKCLLNKIIENINKGMPYGDGKINTKVSDYLVEVCNQFPTISKSDILIILRYCWKSVYLLNSYGGDILLTDKDIWCYMGRLKKNSLDHFYYYIRKLTIKLRVLYKRKKIEWDGYYYFSLSDNQYNNYLALKNKRGKPRKKFKYGNICFYQIKDECRINEHEHRYFFRVPFISRVKFKFISMNFISDKAELIEVRDPLKFKDILISNYEYDVL